MDQHGEGEAALPRPLSAAHSGGPGLLRSSTARDTRRTSGARTSLWYRSILLLPLLVRGAPSPRAPFQRGAGFRRARFSVLPVLGERNVDRGLARQPQADTGRADLSRA